MIYEGKEYKEVTEGETKVGELLHITVLAGITCDVFRLVTKIESDGDILVNLDLPNRVDFVREEDTFKRYRYVKDVDETSVGVFKQGDEVKVIGPSTGGRVEFIGNKTVVLYVCNNGDIRVNEKGYMGDYRPEALELIHQPTDGSLSEWNVEKGDYFVITGDSAGHMLRKNAVVVAVGVNWEDYFEAVELNGDVDWTINYKDVRRPTEQELELIEETPVPKEQNVPLAHANKIQELVQRAATTPGSLADVISAAQSRALKGTPNDAIDAMRYGFENLGKTLKRPTLSDKVNDLFAEIKDIIVAKNENYGDSFSKQYQKYGMVSVEMRLNDKFMRLEQLVAGEKDKVGESIEDTLKDIIGYATLALIELEDKG